LSLTLFNIWFANLSTAKPQQPAPGVNAIEKASSLKRDLLDAIERLGDCLPPNTLDQLIDELGGPDCVAEVPYAIAKKYK